MNINYCYMCLDCTELFDVKIAKKEKCPRCGSSAIKSVASWLRPLLQGKAIVEGSR